MYSDYYFYLVILFLLIIATIAYLKPLKKDNFKEGTVRKLEVEKEVIAVMCEAKFNMKLHARISGDLAEKLDLVINEAIYALPEICERDAKACKAARKRALKDFPELIRKYINMSESKRKRAEGEMILSLDEIYTDLLKMENEKIDKEARLKNFNLS